MSKRIAVCLFVVLVAVIARAQDVSPGKMKIDAAGNVSGDGKVTKRLSPAEQLKEFMVAKGFTVELVASDPEIINPVTIALDDQGRMLVSESHTYRYGPSGSPIKPFKNPVVRLEPKADGKGFDRVLVADGFDDPVMGIAVKGDKLWLSANNYLYQYDYPATGPATNKKTLVVDKNKAWNPFGMFVLEYGPDGLLYLSVGDHKVELIGPKSAEGAANTITSRGTSGVIVRMNPDGTNMERLTQGFRVPYSFEFDPFGQLWLLSNGEGNPNRFARIIPGVDYHCYTRKVDNNWLAGNHPLAPPTFELLRGAHTQLMRYFGEAYPADYQGSLLLCNWGAHGFHGSNRAIFRYHPDERGQIVSKECFISCNDPHFRPAHILLDRDGNLLIADWYGRDDESDMTGRVWRVRYTGPEKTTTPAESSALSELGSPSHVKRQAAMDKAVAGKQVEPLRDYAASSKNALGAASALWSLRRINTAPAHEAVLAGVKNADPRVRRLALELGRQSSADAARTAASALLKDPDAAVRVEAAITLATADALLGVLNSEVAKDQFLRYQTAAHLAKVAGAEHFAKLLGSDDANVRLAGNIALDVAIYEKTPSKPNAILALEGLLARPEAGDIGAAIALVQMHADASMLPVLEKLIARDDVAPAVSSKALIIYRGLAGKIPAAGGKRFLEGVAKGTIGLKDAGDQATLLDLLASEGPTPMSLQLLEKQIRTGAPQVKPAALALARRFGPKSSDVAAILWPVVLNPKTKAEDALDSLATVAVVEAPAKAEMWTKLLDSSDPVVRTDAVRWWRSFKKNPEMAKTLINRSADLVKGDADLRDDLASVFKDLGVASPEIPADDGKRDKAQLAKQTADALSAWSPGDKQKHALLGKQVFERALCTKCHTTVTQNTPLAPSLKGIGTQKLDYLIESILEPSKIIKTGFDTETIVTTAGKSLSGLVKDEGTHLRVQNFDLDVRVPKKEVEERVLQKRSIMPDGQEALLSRREFVDLIAYLSTLK